MTSSLIQTCPDCGVRRSVAVAECHVCGALARRAPEVGAEGATQPEFMGRAAPNESNVPGDGPEAADDGPTNTAEIFDPAAYSVDVVLAYLDGTNETERARILEAEAAGKARKGILG